MADRIKVVFLDVGTTLLDPHPSFHEVAARICRHHGVQVTAEDVERAEPQVWAMLKQREERDGAYGLSKPEAERFWLDVYHFFLHALGVPEPGELPWRLAEEFLKLETWELYPDALPALRELDRRGYTLAVISNWEDWLEELLSTKEVLSLFKFTVVSGVELVAKPNRQLYERAIERAGVAPHEAVHVGDSLENDVIPASEVGITAVLIDRRDRFAGRHEPRIRSLAELPALLERLEAGRAGGEGVAEQAGRRTGP